VKRQGNEKKRLRKRHALLDCERCGDAPRMWVAALAATTGPSVTKNPKVEANPTMADAKGPTTVDSMTGTCDAKVAV